MRPIIFFFALAVGSHNLAAAGLEIVQPRVEQYENGPRVPADTVFSGGEAVYLSFRIGGLKATGEDDDHIHAAYSVGVFDSSGKSFAEPKSGEIQTTLAEEDKKSKWMPKVRYDFRLPETPVPGIYAVKIHVRDENAEGAAAEVEVPFHVGGLQFDPAAGLAIYNFRFLRSERDADVVPAGGAYRAGESVWVKFDIAGHKFGEKNRFDVSYGVTLKDAAGKALYAKPDAAGRTAESEYPTRFVPGVFSLDLDKKIAPGTYSMAISVRDAVGNQTVESAHEFRVE
jgi:hypothetical protein